MTKLLSKNQQESMEVPFSNSYRLHNGSRIVVCDASRAEEAAQFLEEKGFGGIYFDPCGEVETYPEWGVSMQENSGFAVIEFK